MNQEKIAKHDFAAFAWGAIFIWWGITEMFPILPAGSGALGIGLILLGLNAARYASGVPPSRLSTTVGILAAAWGGLDLAGVMLALPYDIPVFAILLLVLGVVMLVQALFDKRIVGLGGVR